MAPKPQVVKDRPSNVDFYSTLGARWMCFVLAASQIFSRIFDFRVRGVRPRLGLRARSFWPRLVVDDLIIEPEGTTPGSHTCRCTAFRPIHQAAAMTPSEALTDGCRQGDSQLFSLSNRAPLLSSLSRLLSCPTPSPCPRGKPERPFLTQQSNRCPLGRTRESLKRENPGQNEKVPLASFTECYTSSPGRQISPLIRNKLEEEAEMERKGGSLSLGGCRAL